MKTRSAVTRLVREHDNITQVLVLLDSELASLAFAEDADDTLAMSVLEYLSDFVDGFHQPKEDRAVEMAGARAPLPPELVAQLASQHARIRDGAAALHADLESALLDAPVSRREIASAGFAYSSELRRNMELEERHVFPLLESALDDADWERIESELGGRPDPLCGEAVHGTYDRLFHELERRAGVEGP
jgi:hemerythrin-like domain-containing protein